jgi:hypothetical protein
MVRGRILDLRWTEPVTREGHVEQVLGGIVELWGFGGVDDVKVEEGVGLNEVRALMNCSMHGISISDGIYYIKHAPSSCPREFTARSNDSQVRRHETN